MIEISKNVGVDMQKNLLMRYFQVSKLLQGRQYPALEDFTKKCEVSTRTIKRDLRVLREEFGAPIEYCFINLNSPKS